jgi:hypothetical protein
MQKSRQNCHGQDSIASMSLLAYDEVRPWAKSIRKGHSARDAASVDRPGFAAKAFDRAEVPAASWEDVIADPD